MHQAMQPGQAIGYAPAAPPLNLDSLMEQVAMVSDSSASGFGAYGFVQQPQVNAPLAYGSAPVPVAGGFASTASSPPASRPPAPWARANAAATPATKAGPSMPASKPPIWHKAGAPLPGVRGSEEQPDEPEEHAGDGAKEMAVGRSQEVMNSLKGTVVPEASAASQPPVPQGEVAVAARAPEIAATPSLADLLTRAAGEVARASGGQDPGSESAARAAMELLTRQFFQAAVPSVVSAASGDAAGSEGTARTQTAARAEAAAAETPLPASARAIAGPVNCSFRYELGAGGDVDAWFRNIKRRIEVELDDGCTVEMCLQMAR